MSVAEGNVGRLTAAGALSSRVARRGVLHDTPGARGETDRRMLYVCKVVASNFMDGFVRLIYGLRIDPRCRLVQSAACRRLSSFDRNHAFLGIIMRPKYSVREYNDNYTFIFRYSGL